MFSQNPIRQDFFSRRNEKNQKKIYDTKKREVLATYGPNQS
jgi:hypothetical protein